MVISVVARGQKVTLIRSFTENEAAQFLESSRKRVGDEDFGVPAGLLTAHLTGQLLDQLLGSGTILRGVFLTFPREIHFDEYVECEATVATADETTGIVRVALNAATSAGMCVKGEAVVTLPTRRRCNG